METLIQTYIGGATFPFTESAHAALKKYLDDIKKHFAKSEAGSEIVKDIEARIGEILAQKNSSQKGTPVTEAVIAQIIAQIGTANEIGGAESEEDTSTEPAPRESAQTESRTRRRLYRDQDDAILGGVCSGIAHYFDIDPTLVRLAAVILTIFTGPTVFLIYIVLWAIVPPAKTTADRLEMEGRSPTIDNIAAKVREEVAYVRENKEHIKTRLKDEATKVGNMIETKASRPLARLVQIILKIAKALVAAMLVLGGTGVILVVSILIGAFFAVKVPLLAIPLSAILIAAASAVFLIVALPATLFILTGAALVLSRAMVGSKFVVALLLVWIGAFAALAITMPNVLARVQDTPAWQNDPDLREIRIDFGEGRSHSTYRTIDSTSTTPEAPVAPATPEAPEGPAAD